MMPDNSEIETQLFVFVQQSPHTESGFADLPVVVKHDGQDVVGIHVVIDSRSVGVKVSLLDGFTVQIDVCHFPGVDDAVFGADCFYSAKIRLF